MSVISQQSNIRDVQTSITHHMKDLSILPGGEDHLGLQARLEEEAMSRHRAASTRRNEGAERT